MSDKRIEEQPRIDHEGRPQVLQMVVEGRRVGVRASLHGTAWFHPQYIGSVGQKRAFAQAEAVRQRDGF
jgi:hypothetical protein